MLKRCASCKVEKPAEEFHKNRSRPGGLQFQCKACSVSAQYFTRYGITLEQYNDMLQKQRGVCAICESACPSGRSLAVDHDHNTGRVRALLCAPCNTAIGKLRDDPALIRRAADYVEKHNGFHS